MAARCLRPLSDTDDEESESASTSDSLITLGADSGEPGGVGARTGSALKHKTGDDDGQPTVRAMLIPMLCVFQGYACMVGPAQQKFKAELGIGQSGKAAMVFTQAAVFVHYGKALARVGHGVFSGLLSPIGRVYASLALMFIGTLVPPLLVFGLGVHWIGLVFISYGLSGIGLGVFECTFLAVVTPMGKLTKAWAIMGIPIGFGIVNILGLLCTSAGMPVVMLYWYIVFMVPVGAAVVYLYGPRRDPAEEDGRVRDDGTPQRGSVQQRGLCTALLDWRVFAAALAPHLVAKAAVNFVMENATPVNYYTYNAEHVPLWGPTDTSTVINHDVYFAVLGLFVLSGDTLSRRVPSSLPLTSRGASAALLGAAALCSFAGFYLESFAVAALAWAGIFCAFWGNGLVYGTTAKFIDQQIPKEYNLAAYSLWCCVGDFGGIIGGITVDLVRNWICGGNESELECLSHN